MRKIQFVDLNNQYLKIKNEIDTALSEVIQSCAFIKGPQVNSFEEELAKYLHVKHVIACANGTDALQIAMMATGLQPGDEVITSNFTFIATVEVMALLKLKIVLVDVVPDTFNLSIEAIEKAITPKTKAIVPVHVFGQCADMEKILAIAHKHNLLVIEDTAQSNGSDYSFTNGKTFKAGTMGHIGCTSFFPSKNLGCFGDGGALFTNDDTIENKIRIVANHGMTKRYYHDEIGVNSRLDTIQAAVLRVKLKYLDQYNAARQKAAEYYDKELADISQIRIPLRSTNSTHIFHQYTIVVKDENRDRLKAHLEKNNIPVMIYYPVPIHMQKAFKNEINKENKFPVTEYLGQHVLSLPMHTELDPEQIHFICDNIKSFFR